MRAAGPAKPRIAHALFARCRAASALASAYLRASIGHLRGDPSLSHRPCCAHVAHRCTLDALCAKLALAPEQAKSAVSEIWPEGAWVQR